jgi:glycosyltransferase involved in cell wall biosynthesis
LNSKSKIHYPKISIITPSFNQGEFIEQTIQSVIEQNYPNLEYIIIDGGSTDNSVEVIQKYSPWITYWVSEKDSGQSDAINKGLKIATGEIINWLNSDDYYEPGALFKIADAFRDKNILVVGGRSFLFTGNKENIQESVGTDVYYNNLPKTIGWARIDQPDTFFRKEAVEVMGPLDTRLHYLMDRDWWVKFLLHFGLNGIKRIPDILVNFRLHENSKTISLGENFQVEHDTYFYSLAKKINLNSVASAIRTNTKIRDDFEFGFEPGDHKLIEKALHYYLLLRADQFYVAHERNKVHALLKSINQEFLEEEDKLQWRKLYFRNKFIPIPVLKILRRK